MGLEAVRAGEPGLPAACRRDHLPRGDVARRVTDDQGPVTEEKPQDAHRDAGAGGGLSRLHRLRVVPIPQVVANDPAGGRADEEILGTAVEGQRGDLDGSGNAERLARFLFAATADQGLLLDHTLDGELGRADLSHRHRPRLRHGGGETQERSLAVRVEQRWLGEDRPGGHGALAVVEDDVESHLE